MIDTDLKFLDNLPLLTLEFAEISAKAEPVNGRARRILNPFNNFRTALHVPWLPRQPNADMTLRIETEADGARKTIRLIGHLKVENLNELADLVEDQSGPVALNLKEINLVDVEAIRFLATCDRHGVPLLHCPPYIRTWIAQEQSRDQT